MMSLIPSSGTLSEYPRNLGSTSEILNAGWMLIVHDLSGALEVSDVNIPSKDQFSSKMSLSMGTFVPICAW